MRATFKTEGKPTIVARTVGLGQDFIRKKDDEAKEGSDKTLMPADLDCERKPGVV